MRSTVLTIGLAVTLTVGPALAGLQVSLQIRRQFEEFEHKFSKKYDSSAERFHRMNVFAENVYENHRHNSRAGVSWRRGINQFSDLTPEEFTKIHLNGYFNTWKNTDLYPTRATTPEDLRSLPESIDWRDKGVITKPKDQGHCGSCWAHATVEQLESYLAIETNGTLEALSPQHLTSCVPNPLNCGGKGGCYGSIPQIGYNYAQLMGVTREADYPYVSGITSQSEECVYDTKQMEAAVYVLGYETLPHNQLAPVMKHLATKGPLSMSADAKEWHQYESGVFDGCDYKKNIMINHSIQLVGYGTDRKTGLDYWLVRNSWGEDFGEQGYIRLLRESTEVCGKDFTPAMGSACQGDGNAVQKVCGMCGTLFDNSYPIGTATESGIKP